MEGETIGSHSAAGVEAGTGWDQVEVLGVPIACVDPESTLSAVAELLDRGGKTYLSLTGVHGVIESRDDPEMFAALQGAGMNLPDGMPMVWAGKRAGSRSIERVYGPDLMLSLLEAAAVNGWPVFFYGGHAGVADALSQRMSSRYPDLTVAGTCSPPFRETGEPEADEVIAGITKSGARIVFVGLSTPKQEVWMANHLDRIGGSVILVGVGAAFDIHAGLRSDAPKWIGRLGFQWFYRLVSEPRRLWRRYLSIVPRYLVAVSLDRPRLIAKRLGSK